MRRQFTEEILFNATVVKLYDVTNERPTRKGKKPDETRELQRLSSFKEASDFAESKRRGGQSVRWIIKEYPALIMLFDNSLVVISDSSECINNDKPILPIKWHLVGTCRSSCKKEFLLRESPIQLNKHGLEYYYPGMKFYEHRGRGDMQGYKLGWSVPESLNYHETASNLVKYRRRLINSLAKGTIGCSFIWESNKVLIRAIHPFSPLENQGLFCRDEITSIFLVSKGVKISKPRLMANYLFRPSVDEIIVIEINNERKFNVPVLSYADYVSKSYFSSKQESGHGLD